MNRLFLFFEKRPIVSFLLVLILLFGVIYLASVSREPKEVGQGNIVAPKVSRVFAVREAGFITTTAQVKKSGVVDIVAVTDGMVQSISVRAGQFVGAGTTLAVLTNDYGVNAGRLGAERAQLEQDFIYRVFSLEKEINARERKIADENEELSNREEKNSIDTLRVELKRLELNREMARLNTAIANASDAVLRPKSLVAGTVEFIGVRSGEMVHRGELIATIRGSKSTDTLVSTLPNDLARYVDPSGIGTLVLGEERISLRGTYFAKGENTLGLRSLTFALSEATSAKLTESEFVTLLLPLTHPEGEFFVPLDAIFSGNGGMSVLVLDGNKVTEKSVDLGDVAGSFVLVKSGLNETDEVLVNRGLIPGESVEVLR